MNVANPAGPPDTMINSAVAASRVEMQGDRRGRSPNWRNISESEDGDEDDDDDLDEDEVWEREDGFEPAITVDNEGILVTSTT
eukprot:2438638-Heterocapsa_arctica.AAC.1